VTRARLASFSLLASLALLAAGAAPARADSTVVLRYDLAATLAQAAQTGSLYQNFGASESGLTVLDLGNDLKTPIPAEAVTADVTVADDATPHVVFDVCVNEGANKVACDASRGDVIYRGALDHVQIPIPAGLKANTPLHVQPHNLYADPAGSGEAAAAARGTVTIRFA
jgi:hypothetical protein